MDTHRLPDTSPPFSSGFQENHDSIWEMFLCMSGFFTLLWAPEDQNLCLICFSISCTKQFLMSERHLVLVLWEVSPTAVVSFYYFVVQSVSRVQLFATLWSASHQASLSFTISRSLLKLMFIESVMPSNHLILSCPLSCPQSFPASGSFCVACGILVPWPEIEPVPPASKSGALTTGLPGKFQKNNSWWQIHIEFRTQNELKELTESAVTKCFPSQAIFIWTKFFSNFIET